MGRIVEKNKEILENNFVFVFLRSLFKCKKRVEVVEAMKLRWLLLEILIPFSKCGSGNVKLLFQNQKRIFVKVKCLPLLQLLNLWETRCLDWKLFPFYKDYVNEVSRLLFYFLRRDFPRMKSFFNWRNFKVWATYFSYYIQQRT